MIEVEVKVCVSNRQQIEDKLLQIGFFKGDLLKESDFYFDNDAKDMRSHDKALRIRSCENITTNVKEHFITFKGPKMDNVSMTRKELEMKIESTKIGKEIFKELGYTPVRPVIKLRQSFQMGMFTACLDQVEDLGDFLELEAVVAQEKEKEAALEKIILLLRELGYEPGEIIRTSYLSMLQENKSIEVFGTISRDEINWE